MRLLAFALGALCASAPAAPALASHTAMQYACTLVSGNGPFGSAKFVVTGRTLIGTGRWTRSALEEGEMTFKASQPSGQAAGGGLYMGGGGQSGTTTHFQLALREKLGRQFAAISAASPKAQTTGLYRCRVRTVNRPLPSAPASR